MAEREPVPELAEHEEPDGCLHVHVTGPRLEGDGHVSSTCCEKGEQRREWLL